MGARFPWIIGIYLAAILLSLPVHSQLEIEPELLEEGLVRPVPYEAPKGVCQKDITTTRLEEVEVYPPKTKRVCKSFWIFKWSCHDEIVRETKLENVTHTTTIDVCCQRWIQMDKAINFHSDIRTNIICIPDCGTDCGQGGKCIEPGDCECSDGVRRAVCDNGAVEDNTSNEEEESQVENPAAGEDKDEEESEDEMNEGEDTTDAEESEDNGENKEENEEETGEGESVNENEMENAAEGNETLPEENENEGEEGGNEYTDEITEDNNANEEEKEYVLAKALEKIESQQVAMLVLVTILPIIWILLAAIFMFCIYHNIIKKMNENKRESTNEIHGIENALFNSTLEFEKSMKNPKERNGSLPQASSTQ